MDLDGLLEDLDEKPAKRAGLARAKTAAPKKGDFIYVSFTHRKHRLILVYFS